MKGIGGFYYVQTEGRSDRGEGQGYLSKKTVRRLLSGTL